MNLYTLLSILTFIAILLSQYKYYYVVRAKARREGVVGSEDVPHSKTYLYLSYALFLLIFLLFLSANTPVMQGRVF